MNIIELHQVILPQVKKLLNKEPETISSIEKNDEGWVILCDVLERKAVPETFDILKIFELKVNNEGKINSYRQIKKVRRGDYES